MAGLPDDSSGLVVRLDASTRGSVKRLQKSIKEAMLELASADLSPASSVAIEQLTLNAILESAKTIQGLVKVDIIWPIPPWGRIPKPPRKSDGSASRVASTTCIQAISGIEVALRPIKTECSLKSLMDLVGAHEKATLMIAEEWSSSNSKEGGG